MTFGNLEAQELDRCWAWCRSNYEIYQFYTLPNGKYEFLKFLRLHVRLALADQNEIIYNALMQGLMGT